jgi:alkanesulfonate monooxygenase SsuD/methylene tetrahydromethanopterin reductase-like flavin-dependent oxidoreductase (luciferase family)
VGHTIAWRHPEHAKFTEFETYVRFAQTAERGRFDFIFFGEGLVVREHQGRFFGPIVNGRPDTIALLPALAAVTEKIGLAATLSSTYNAPYELARQPVSIDHVSGGRAAWNVVTTFSNSAAKDSGGDQVAYNFSKEKHLDHATRYDRAREFVTLLKKLWDSWDDDALAGGRLDLAQYGRSKAEIRILPGLAVVVAPTGTEAQAKAAYYRELLGTPAIGCYLLGEQSGHDFSDVDLDGPFPDIDTTQPEVNGELLERWKTLAKMTISPCSNSLTASPHAGPWSTHRRRSPIIARPGSRLRLVMASFSPRPCSPATSTTSCHWWCPSCSNTACSARHTSAARCVSTSDSSVLPCRHGLRGEKGTELIPLRISHNRPA